MPGCFEHGPQHLAPTRPDAPPPRAWAGPSAPAVQFSESPPRAHSSRFFLSVVGMPFPEHRNSFGIPLLLVNRYHRNSSQVKLAASLSRTEACVTIPFPGWRWPRVLVRTHPCAPGPLDTHRERRVYCTSVRARSLCSFFFSFRKCGEPLVHSPRWFSRIRPGGIFTSLRSHEPPRRERVGSLCSDPWPQSRPEEAGLPGPVCPVRCPRCFGAEFL